MTTSAQLRLGPSASYEEVEKTVTILIEKLGLTKAADTIVGNAKVRGLSGGERKRLSIACELLGNPSLLFCDEPTTGLDSFQAQQVYPKITILLVSIVIKGKSAGGDIVTLLVYHTLAFALHLCAKCHVSR